MPSKKNKTKEAISLFCSIVLFVGTYFAHKIKIIELKITYNVTVKLVTGDRSYIKIYFCETFILIQIQIIRKFHEGLFSYKF